MYGSRFRFDMALGGLGVKIADTKKTRRPALQEKASKGCDSHDKGKREFEEINCDKRQSGKCIMHAMLEKAAATAGISIWATAR